MKTISALLTVSLLGGCAGSNIKAQVAGANIEIARAKAAAMSKPLVEIAVPLQSCTATPGNNCVLTVVVRAPGGGGSGDYVAAPDDPWARVAERTVGGLVTTGGIFLGGQAAANIAGAAANGIVNALRVQPAPVVVDTPAPMIVNQPEPLVVNQPTPLVVTQPAPLVVTQPAPIIITQPAP